jgi:hypothetical protein
MLKPKMYAMCTSNQGAGMLLEKGKEYRIVSVKSYLKFGDDCFFILEDGLAYASNHFSVTYLK